MIEIDLVSGAPIRIGGAVDGAALSEVLENHLRAREAFEGSGAP